eukprot:scaffold155598_cov22-Tisochrysis_lutea.AAC.1
MPGSSNAGKDMLWICRMTDSGNTSGYMLQICCMPVSGNMNGEMLQVRCMPDSGITGGNMRQAHDASVAAEKEIWCLPSSGSKGLNESCKNSGVCDTVARATYIEPHICYLAGLHTVQRWPKHVPITVEDLSCRPSAKEEIASGHLGAPEQRGSGNKTDSTSA